MRLRLLIEWCAIAAFTLAVVAGLHAGRVMERVDNVAYDLLVGLLAPPASERILLVVIDDESVGRIGRWPWRREVHARMLEQLAAARPAAVAYDVLFTEPAGEDDERLAAAMRGLGTVALPVLFEAPGLNGNAIDVTPPVEPLADAARALGQVALIPDSEGVARSVPLRISAGGREWVHLMEETYRIAQGHPSTVFQDLVERGEPAARVPFLPSTGEFRSIPFASVLAGEVPENFLRDRIVLVGATAPGLGDRFRVPTRTGPLITGLELQANLLSSLVAGRVVTVPGDMTRLLFALLPPLMLLVSFWWLRPSRALKASLAAIALTLAVPLALMLFAHVWLPPATALVGLLIAYPLWGWRRLQAVDREIGQELTAFAAEPGPVAPLRPPAAYLDPVGGQTARLRAAIGEMRDLRRLVSDTIDGVADPLLVTDLEDAVILANRTAQALFGEALEGARSAPLLAALAGRKVAFGEGAPEILLEGQRTFSPRRFSLRSHSGEQRGWIVHLVDISDIRRAQSEREAALEFLSHDMRSPQTAIITLLDRHRSSIANRDLADRIAGLARKTLNLADTFVQLARFSVASFAPEDVNLGDVLTEAADELWPQASRRNVRIAIEGAEEAHYLAAERDTLSRALVNLLDNAIKFSPDGGTIRCAVQAGDGTVECTIEDEGPGVPEERREDLFARYGHRQQTKGARSAGLGLAYVAATVDRHGGTISHEPRPGGGTRFVLRFPAAD